MFDKPPLCEPAQLEGLPGGPWSSIQVRAAGDAVRQAARWHIAPRVTETVVLDHDGANRVILPTLYARSVTSVRSLLHDEPVVIEGWRVSSNGVLAGRRFPAGIAVLEVTFEHGYELCPADLLPVIADAATQVKLASRAAGPFSESYDRSAGASLLDHENVLARHRLAYRP